MHFLRRHFAQSIAAESMIFIPLLWTRLQTGHGFAQKCHIFKSTFLGGVVWWSEVLVGALIVRFPPHNLTKRRTSGVVVDCPVGPSPSGDIFFCSKATKVAGQVHELKVVTCQQKNKRSKFAGCRLGAYCIFRIRYSLQGKSLPICLARQHLAAIFKNQELRITLHNSQTTPSIFEQKSRTSKQALILEGFILVLCKLCLSWGFPARPSQRRGTDIRRRVTRTPTSPRRSRTPSSPSGIQTRCPQGSRAKPNTHPQRWLIPARIFLKTAFFFSHFSFVLCYIPSSPSAPGNIQNILVK